MTTTTRRRMAHFPALRHGEMVWSLTVEELKEEMEGSSLTLLCSTHTQENTHNIWSTFSSVILFYFLLFIFWFSFYPLFPGHCWMAISRLSSSEACGFLHWFFSLHSFARFRLFPAASAAHNSQRRWRKSAVNIQSVSWPTPRLVSSFFIETVENPLLTSRFLLIFFSFLHSPFYWTQLACFFKDSQFILSLESSAEYYRWYQPGSPWKIRNSTFTSTVLKTWQMQPPGGKLWHAREASSRLLRLSPWGLVPIFCFKLSWTRRQPRLKVIPFFKWW
jgi:hypothetical protein